MLEAINDGDDAYGRSGRGKRMTFPEKEVARRPDSRYEFALVIAREWFDTWSNCCFLILFKLSVAYALHYVS